MTKVDGRDSASATQQLDQSLRRLRTDHVDLWQFHEVLRFEDPNRIFAANGALKVAMYARKAGKIRFIGFTGHKDPHVHLYMLQIAAQHGFHFDAVLDKTRQAGSAGHYELFKTTSHYDSTAHHPEWLGGPSSDLSQLL